MEGFATDLLPERCRGQVPPCCPPTGTRVPPVVVLAVVSQYPLSFQTTLREGSDHAFALTLFPW